MSATFVPSHYICLPQTSAAAVSISHEHCRFARFG
ncbi:hypothetical protein B23_1426 [Geobacillus thermoleovorans B23]|nr:hypothetical protein B23_1426 [Geobacillus thermoleovorans B23]